MGGSGLFLPDFEDEGHSPVPLVDFCIPKVRIKALLTGSSSNADNRSGTMLDLASYERDTKI
jgi:hypothetical protein